MQLFLSILSLLGCALASGAGVEISSENWTEVVESSGDVWAIEYESRMCGSCKEFKPVWETLASELSTRVRVGSVSIDDKVR